MLAICPDPKFRDRTRAVELAGKTADVLLLDAIHYVGLLASSAQSSVGGARR
jgi:hypothetical protein